MSGFVRFKTSRLQPRGIGFWRARKGGGIALVDEPSVISGVYLNTRWGLFGWDRYYR